jgi:hypothetical protein
MAMMNDLQDPSQCGEDEDESKDTNRTAAIGATTGAAGVAGASASASAEQAQARADVAAVAEREAATVAAAVVTEMEEQARQDVVIPIDSSAGVCARAQREEEEEEEEEEKKKKKKKKEEEQKKVWHSKLVKATVCAIVSALAVWTCVADVMRSDTAAAPPPPSPAADAGNRPSFPIALLQKHCDSVPQDVHAAFASPSTVLMLACLAALAAQLTRLKDDVKKIALVDKMKPALLEGAKWLRRKYEAKKAAGAQALSDSKLSQSSVKAAEKLAGRLERWTEAEGLRQLELLAGDLRSLLTEAEIALKEKFEAAAGGGGGENAAGAGGGGGGGSGGGDDKADNDALQSRIKQLEEEVHAANDESRHAGRETAEEASRRERLAFALLYLALVVGVLAAQAPDMLRSIAGSSLPCLTSKILILPMYKPLAIPMWGVLLTVLKYVHWEAERETAPKKVVLEGLLRAGRRPVNRNWLLDAVLYSTAALGLWCCAALLVVPAFVGFAPATIVLVLLVPLLLIGLPLWLLSRSRTALAKLCAATKRCAVRALSCGTKQCGSSTRSSVSTTAEHSGSGEEVGGEVTEEGTAADSTSASGRVVANEAECFAEATAAKDLNELTVWLSKMSELGLEGKPEFAAGQALREKLTEEDWRSKLELSVASMLSQQGELMLKIGMVLCFASVMFMAWFMDHFYGGGATQSWAEAMGVAALRLPDLSLELVLEFGVTLRWPSELPTLGQFTIVAALSVAAAQNVLGLFRWLDLRDRPQVSDARKRVRKPTRAFLHAMGRRFLGPFSMSCGWLSKEDGTDENERLVEVKDELVEEHVTNNGSELKELDLSGCTNVTDATLAVLQRTCSESLTRLNLKDTDTEKLTAGAILSLSTHCEQLPLGAGGITLPEGEGAKVPDMLEKWLEEKPYAETLNLRGAGNIPGQLAVRLLLELPMLRDAGLELSAYPADWGGGRPKWGDRVRIKLGEQGAGSVGTIIEKNRFRSEYRLLHPADSTHSCGRALSFNPTSHSIGSSFSSRNQQRLHPEITAEEQGHFYDESALEFVNKGDGMVTPQEVLMPGLMRLSLACVHGRLDLSQWKLQAVDAFRLARQLPSCTALVVLDLSDNSIGDEGAASVAAALPSCKKLVALDLSMNKIKAQGAARVAAALPSCKKLELLKLGGSYATALPVMELKTATTVNLSGKLLTEEDKIVIVKLFHGNAMVVTLNLANVSSLRDDFLVNLARSCRGLTDLNLSGFQKLCGNISGDAVAYLARCCTGLVTIDLSGCDQVADVALVGLAEHCTGLASINLARTTGDLSVRQISDAAFMGLAQRCPGLTELSLGGCWTISDASVSELAHCCTGLAAIDLSWCEKVTDIGVSELARYCTGLTTIDISSNQYYAGQCNNRISDASVMELARCCTGLVKIKLSNCDKVTGAAVADLKGLLPGCTVIGHI